MLECDGSKKKLAIYLNTNKKCIFALCSFILNIKKYIHGYDNIIVCHSGDLSLDDVNIISRFDDKILFDKYDITNFASELQMEENIIKSSSFIKTYTLPTLTKFRMLKYLESYKCVIFFDTDMLILDKIDELFTGNFNIAYRLDQGSSIWHKIKSFNSASVLKDIESNDQKLFQKSIAPNGGLIILNDNFDYLQAYNLIKIFLKKYFPGIISNLLDEIYFSYIANYMNLNIRNLDGNVYNVIPSKITLKSKLIHFYRHYKPWKNEVIQYCFRSWIENYHKYLAISQTSSNEVKIFSNIGKDFLAPCFRYNAWISLFEKNNFTYPEILKIRHYLFTKSYIDLIYDHRVKYRLRLNGDKRIDLQLIINNSSTYGFNIMIDHLKLFDISNARIKSNKVNVIFIYCNQICTLDNVQNHFLDFYNKTAAIREISHSLGYSNANSHPCKNMIATFHGTYLSYDDKHDKLYHGNDGNYFVTYSRKNNNEIALMQGDKYITYDDKMKKFLLDAHQFYFDLDNCDNGQVNIRYNNQQLRALDDGSTDFTNNNKEWEKYDLEF